MMVATFSLYHIEGAKLNPAQLILVGTILEIACFIFEIPTGIVADIYSRKLSIIIGLFLMGTGFFIEGYFPIFGIILISQIVWGIGATFLSGADIAWISDEIGQNKIDSVLLKAARLSQIGSIGGIICGVLLASIQINLGILISGLLFLVLSIILFVIMPEKNFNPYSKPDRNIIKEFFSILVKGISLIKKQKFLFMLLLPVFLVGFYSEGFDRLWALKFLETGSLLNWEIDTIYWFAVVYCGSYAINFFLIGYIEKKIDNKENISGLWILILNNSLTLIAISFFAFHSNFIIILLSVWLTNATRNLNIPLFNILFNRNITDSSVRATVISFKGQVDQVAQILGGLLLVILLKLL